MNCYRVYFAFGDDQETDCRCKLVDAESVQDAVNQVASSLADNPEGFIIGNIECLSS